MFPNYYDRLCTVLPWAVFLPKRDDGIAKETVCLALIVDAHRQGLVSLSNQLQDKLHPELRDVSLTVMKHRLQYLIEDAQNDPMSKITPVCPYEANWIRNQGNNPGFKAWREKYDETCSSYKGNSNSDGCDNSGNGSKGTNVRPTPN